MIKSKIKFHPNNQYYSAHSTGTENRASYKPLDYYSFKYELKNGILVDVTKNKNQIKLKGIEKMQTIKENTHRVHRKYKIYKIKLQRGKPHCLRMRQMAPANNNNK